jgi:hypothetical protein
MTRCTATIRRGDKHGEVKPTVCGGWLRFIGITRHKSFGWRKWLVCESPYCGLYTAVDETGMVRAIQKVEPPKHSFRSDPHAR